MVNNKSILDLIRNKIINKLFNNNNTEYLSNNTFILKLYYKSGTFLCSIIYVCIIYNLFMVEIILCSDGHGNHDKKLRFALINFCLSYPQLSNNSKQFALFYKWVPWIMILLCFLFYTPKILINNFSCQCFANYIAIINKLSCDKANNDKKRSRIYIKKIN